MDINIYINLILIDNKFSVAECTQMDGHGMKLAFKILVNYNKFPNELQNYVHDTLNWENYADI